MQTQHDLAIVLKVVAYGERDKIVTAITEKHGKITALAKNSVHSRRFGGSLDLFAASEWSFTEKYGSDMVHLTDADFKRAFDAIPKNFLLLALASVFNEILLRVAQEGARCEDLFKLHSNALVAVEELAKEPDPRTLSTLLNAYLAKILHFSGQHPRLEACLDCNRGLRDFAPDEPLNCLIPEAAWTCSKCRPVRTVTITPLAVSDFFVALTQPIRKVISLSHADEKAHQDLLTFLESLLVFHIPGFDHTALKSLKFVKGSFS